MKEGQRHKWDKNGRDKGRNGAKMEETKAEMGQKWKRDKGKNGRETKAEMGQNWKTDKGKNGR
jgi:hypothetical protein